MKRKIAREEQEKEDKRVDEKKAAIPFNFYFVYFGKNARVGCNSFNTVFINIDIYAYKYIFILIGVKHTLGQL